jgi:hypothetical protein
MLLKPTGRREQILARWRAASDEAGWSCPETWSTPGVEALVDAVR